MNSLAEIPVTSFMVALTGALAPGPLMVTTVRESSYGRSVKPGLLLSLGHALAEAPVTVLLAYGLLNINKEFFPVLSLVGGVMLIATGLISVFKPSSVNREANSPVGIQGLMSLIILGATISFSNPYWITWWLTIGAAYVSKALAWGALGIILFYFSHEMGDLVVLGLISKVMAKGARSIGEKRLRILIILCNIAIIVIGVYFMLEGTGALVSAYL
ncbi:MAG: LysE family transporter [Thermoproteota archaeon]